MAIVINGSGTVTGISVGGLPDDIVDAGTLADNAVGLAQMASGTDGNIITYDTSGNPAVVATGSSGQVLTSAGADAVPTMATLSAGKVLQVVSAAINPSGASTTSDSFVVSQLTAAITPTATSSKILVICNAHGSNEQETRYLHWTIYRGSTNLGNGDAGMGQMFTDSDTRVRSSISAHILDSPNTTSATTYALYYRSGSSGETVELPPSTSQMNITLIEIGA